MEEREPRNIPMLVMEPDWSPAGTCMADLQSSRQLIRWKSKNTATHKNWVHLHEDLKCEEQKFKTFSKTIDKISQTKCNTALRKTDPMQLHYSEECLLINKPQKEWQHGKAGREGGGEGAASRCAALHSGPRHEADQQWSVASTNWGLPEL